MERVAEPDHRFEIPGAAQVVTGKGGLPVVRIHAPGAEGELYLHGAHVTSWKPRGAEEVLFVSSRSRFDSEHAIRGGIPICFPWFGSKAGEPKAPAHGFARTKMWQLESIEQVAHAVAVSMVIESDDSTRKWWPSDFRLLYRVTFGSELSLDLVIRNTGTASLRFEEALHTYYRLGNIEDARVRGLEATDYLDKTDSGRKKTQHGEIVISSEVDRVYLNTTGAIEVEDRSMRRRIRTAKEGSRTTVVWNPWIDKARSLSDFADDEWRQMICIETSNVSDYAVDLAPGQEHKMNAIIRISDF
jgi:glucose-6-phosphate 1-epimerase